MTRTRNHLVLASCCAVVAAMLGLSYAAVPLYEMFCRITGYGGTPARAEAAPGPAGDRFITVRFDTNVDPALPWYFQPEQRAIKVKLGEEGLAFFRAENRGERPIVGTATFNVVPEAAARYFNKIQCFCFSQQRLEAGQSVDMPVSFFVAPELALDRTASRLTEITLSYTFFPAANPRAEGKTASAPAKGYGG